jgi:hypothetical protein
MRASVTSRQSPLAFATLAAGLAAAIARDDGFAFGFALLLAIIRLDFLSLFYNANSGSGVFRAAANLGYNFSQVVGDHGVIV